MRIMQKIILTVISLVLFFTVSGYSFEQLRVPMGLDYHIWNLGNGEQVEIIRIRTIGDFEKYREAIYDIAITLPDKRPAPAIFHFVARNKDDMDNHIIYIALSNNKVAGYIIGCIENNRWGHENLHLWAIGIKEDGINIKNRKKGIGNLLLGVMAEEIQARNFYTLHTIVALNNNNLLDFFVHRGFKVTDIGNDSCILQAKVPDVIKRTKGKMHNSENITSLSGFSSCL